MVELEDWQEETVILSGDPVIIESVTEVLVATMVLGYWRIEIMFPTKRFVVIWKGSML